MIKIISLCLIVLLSGCGLPQTYTLLSGENLKLCLIESDGLTDDDKKYWMVAYCEQ